mmetsp:Transcript_5556/g.10729  ORF Transcript_5556/g.10729 Transcript_5556/m.10729 type:complete len:85 (-) Transcript_5556:782-1036(-)
MMKSPNPSIPIAGTNQNDSIPPNQPIVIYIVIDIHLGIRSGPNTAVKTIPMIAKNHATPKKDQPMTVSWNKTRQNGVKVPAMRG